MGFDGGPHLGLAFVFERDLRRCMADVCGSVSAMWASGSDVGMIVAGLIGGVGRCAQAFRLAGSCLRMDCARGASHCLEMNRIEQARLWRAEATSLASPNWRSVNPGRGVQVSHRVACRPPPRTSAGGG
jgi:hypothetical protein